jgi:quinol-cytochrome oxidoreductase complex cytochrome b subunit
VSDHSLWLSQTIVTTMMTGVIWVVQIVLYPLFKPYADRGEVEELEKLHQYYTPKITFVVLPLMFIELGLALWSLALERSLIQVVLLALVLGAWAVTFFISVPCHNIVTNSGEALKKQQAVTRLIHTNWLRTCFWSARACVLWFFLY